MTNDDKIRRAQNAERILADQLFTEAREHIDAELWRLFCEAKPTDAEALAQIKSMQYMHVKYIAFLKAAATDGKLAKAEIERAKRTNFIDRLIK